MSEKRNGPDLRFQEFGDKWNPTRLGIIATNIGYGLNSSAVEYDGTHKYIRITDINEESNRFVPAPLSSPDIIPDPSYQLSEGDILFARTGASVGKTYLYSKEDGDLYFAGFLIRFSILAQDSKFVFYQTKRWEYHKWVKVMSMRSGQPGINAEEYKSYPFNIPSLSEQKKIVEFLTTVDKRIELLMTKKEKLEAYKKGVMQQIFSQKLRFKSDDGSDFPDWEERKLGEVYEFRTTNSFSRDKMNEEGGEFRNIHYGDIHTKLPTIVDLDLVSLPFVNEDVEIRKTFSDNRVEAGDLIIADASEDYNDIGKTIEVINTGRQSVLAGLHTLHAKRVDGSIAIGFGGYLMKSQEVRNQVKRIAQGTKVLSISVPRMSDLNILIPKPEEQKKIVQFLTSLDSSIEMLEKQINQTQTWKKGLLQKMFV